MKRTRDPISGELTLPFQGGSVTMWKNTLGWNIVRVNHPNLIMKYVKLNPKSKIVYEFYNGHLAPTWLDSLRTTMTWLDYVIATPIVSNKLLEL